MAEGNRYNSYSEQAAECFTELMADEIAQSSSCLQTQSDPFFGETGQEFQPPNEPCLASLDCNHDILKEEEEPTIKKFRRPAQDKPIDEEEEKTFISALPGEDENWIMQCVRSRPQSPDYACADPQFQTGSFDPPSADVTEHEQFIWSQEFALRADWIDWISISGVYRGRRRHAICEELDTTVSLVRSRNEESFNLRNISHELDILTGSRKRKR